MTMPDPLPLSPETHIRMPAGTRLVLASETFLEDIGTRTIDGYRIRATWGEPSSEGWYEPTFTIDYTDSIEQEARTLARTQWATWLLDIDYGVDFSTPGNRAPVDVLEEMVRIADADPKYQFGGEAYYVLSAELGDWRAENAEAAALSRLGERE